MEDKHHILVVDDDTRLRELLQQFLRDNGFSVTVAINAADARKKLALFKFDLIVLDVMMPEETGIEFAKSFEGGTPILLLTAMAETEDKITGLEAGADDYLVKPFEPRELVLRINAILRRTVQKTNSVINFGEYSLSGGVLRKDDGIISLTSAELQLLTALAEKSPNPVEREELAQILGTSANERNVDVQITRLRKKIELDSSKPVYIQTVRGAGYILYTK